MVNLSPGCSNEATVFHRCLPHPHKIRANSNLSSGPNIDLNYNNSYTILYCIWCHNPRNIRFVSNSEIMRDSWITCDWRPRLLCLVDPVSLSLLWIVTQMCLLLSCLLEHRLPQRFRPSDRILGSQTAGYDVCLKTHSSWLSTCHLKQWI